MLLKGNVGHLNCSFFLLPRDGTQWGIRCPLYCSKLLFLFNLHNETMVHGNEIGKSLEKLVTSCCIVISLFRISS